MRTNRVYYKHYRDSGGALVLNDSELFKIFSFINEAIIREVLNGNKVRLPHIGDLRIKKMLRTKPAVDLGSTMSRKREIIENGDTPYKEWKENGVIKNNGGIKYLIYYMDSHYFKFDIGNNRKLLFNNIKYWFRPFKSAKQKLTKVKKSYE